MAKIRNSRFDPVPFVAQNWVEHGWGDAALGASAITSVLRLYRLYQAVLDDLLKSYDLNYSRWEVLVFIYVQPRQLTSLGTISSDLQLTRATITNTVDHLERLGFVKRTPNPVDSRGTLAVITKKGRVVGKKATELLNEKVFEALSLDAKEIRQLNALLLRVRTSIGSELAG